MHASSFSYNISRPYPYRWFTWVVVFGGLAATALFSVINLAATGYESQIIYVANTTEIEHPTKPAWFQKRPWSWSWKVVSNCQGHTLQVGDQFYTDKLGFSYKITKLTRGNAQSPIASFTYRNNYLQDCMLSYLKMTGNVTSSLLVIPLNCTVYENNESIHLELSLSLYVNFFGASNTERPGPRLFRIQDVTHAEPGLFWGIKLVAIFQRIQFLFKGTVSGTWFFSTPYEKFGDPIPSEFKNATFIVSRDLQFGNSSDGVSLYTNTSNCKTLETWTTTYGENLLRSDYLKLYGNSTLGPITQINGVFNAIHPDIHKMILLDNAAKVLYSLILTDLGQSTTSNILASPQSLIDFVNGTIRLQRDLQRDVSNLSNYFREPYNLSVCSWSRFLTLPDHCDPPPEVNAFYAYANTSLPYVNSSVISMQYLCQVPKLKSIGSVIINVIVADLVFLQALWLVFTFIVSFFVERQDPQANYCAGCTAMPKSMSPDTELASRSSISYQPHPQPNPVLTPTSPIMAPTQATPARVNSGGASIRSGVSSIVWHNCAEGERREGATVVG